MIILARVKVILMIVDPEIIENIPEGKGITREEVENLQINKVEGIQEEEGPLIMEDPLMVEDPLMIEDPLIMEDPLVMEDPLIMEDPLEMEDHQEDLEDKGHQVPPDLLDLYVQ